MWLNLTQSGYVALSKIYLDVKMIFFFSYILKSTNKVKNMFALVMPNKNKNVKDPK